MMHPRAVFGPSHRACSMRPPAPDCQNGSEKRGRENAECSPPSPRFTRRWRATPGLRRVKMRNRDAVDAGGYGCGRNTRRGLGRVKRRRLCRRCRLLHSLSLPSTRPDERMISPPAAPIAYSVVCYRSIQLRGWASMLKRKSIGNARILCFNTGGLTCEGRQLRVPRTSRKILGLANMSLQTEEDWKARRAAREISLRERIASASQALDFEKFRPEFLSWIRADTKTALAHVQRSFYMACAGVLVFELLCRAAIKEISIGPVSVKDFRLLHQLLAPTIALFGLRMWAWLDLTYDFVMAQHALLWQMRPELWRNRLDHLAFSPCDLAALVSPARAKPIRSGTLSLGRLIVWLITIAAASPWFFVAYAIYRLSQLYPLLEITNLAAIVSSVAILVFTTVIAVELKGRMRKWAARDSA